MNIIQLELSTHRYSLNDAKTESSVQINLKIYIITSVEPVRSLKAKTKKYWCGNLHAQINKLHRLDQIYAWIKKIKQNCSFINPCLSFKI